MPLGVSYQKVFKSSPVNLRKCLEETVHIVVTFSSSQNVPKTISLTRSTFPPILPSLANSSAAHAFPLCISLVISAFTGRLPQTFA